MAQDAEVTLAFVAKRQGKDAMPSSEWSHILSLELGWMGPGTAREFIAASSAAGLLVEAGDNLQLGFDRTQVSIPRGFRPPESIEVQSPTLARKTTGSKHSEDPFLDLIARIVEASDIIRDEILQQVSEVQDRFGGKLSAIAAATHVAIKHGVSPAAEAAAALAAITSKSK